MTLWILRLMHLCKAAWPLQVNGWPSASSILDELEESVLFNVTLCRTHCFAANPAEPCCTPGAFMKRHALHVACLREDQDLDLCTALRLQCSLLRAACLRGLPDAHSVRVVPPLSQAMPCEALPRRKTPHPARALMYRAAAVCRGAGGRNNQTLNA